MSANTPAAVIWDFEGTLVTRVRSDLEVAVEELALIGLTPGMLSMSALANAHARYLSASAAWRTIDEEIDGYVDLLRFVLAQANHQANISRRRVEQRVRRGFDAYMPIPGMVDVLRAVQRAGVRHAVVSNWLPSLRSVLDALSIGSFFEVVVVSAIEGVRKPDVALLQRALDRLSMPASATIVVGDDPDLDLVPASNLGCAVIHFDPLGDASPGIRSAPELLRRLLGVLRV